MLSLRHHTTNNNIYFYAYQVTKTNNAAISFFDLGLNKAIFWGGVLEPPAIKSGVHVRPETPQSSRDAQIDRYERKARKFGPGAVNIA